jgi:hypothetical protein
VDKIIQMIPSAFEDFREVSRCCEGTKRQICTPRCGSLRFQHSQKTITVKVKGLPVPYGLFGETVILCGIPSGIPADQLVTWKRSTRDQRLSDALAGRDATIWSALPLAALSPMGLWHRSFESGGAHSTRCLHHVTLGYLRWDFPIRCQKTVSSMARSSFSFWMSYDLASPVHPRDRLAIAAVQSEGEARKIFRDRDQPRRCSPRQCIVALGPPPDGRSVLVGPTSLRPAPGKANVAASRSRPRNPPSSDRGAAESCEPRAELIEIRPYSGALTFRGRRFVGKPVFQSCSRIRCRTI